MKDKGYLSERVDCKRREEALLFAIYLVVQGGIVLFETVFDFVHKHDLFKKGKTVAIGVSGGPDSMALLHFFLRIQSKFSLKLVILHVDHQFRGDVSYEDYQFVETYAKKHNLLFEGTCIDVTSYAKKHQKTSQVAARECRYQFFFDMMKKHKADYLALAHHGDDQIETMLMRQTLAGFQESVCGIPVKRPFATGHIIRPFLCVSKKEIESYCKQHHIDYRKDASNDTDDYVRNRFRHYILPFLYEENQAVHIRYQLLSEACFDDERYLKEEAKKALERIIVRKETERVIFNIVPFLTLSKSLQRRAIHLILNYLYHETTHISFVHIEQIIEVLKSEEPSKEVHLPLGLIVRKTYDQCVCSFHLNKQSAYYKHELVLNEKVPLKVGTIETEFKETMDDDKDLFTCYVPLVYDSFPLFVRSRKKGDRMALPNGGTKKVKDLFIDAKIPKHLRDKWPIVTDCHDRIVWVPKVKHSSLIMLSGEEKRFFMLKFKEVEGLI